jgi:hypothetical protein
MVNVTVIGCERDLAALGRHAERGAELLRDELGLPGYDPAIEADDRA